MVAQLLGGSAERNNSNTKLNESTPAEVNVEGDNKKKQKRTKPKLVSDSIKSGHEKSDSRKKQQQCKSCTII